MATRKTNDGTVISKDLGVVIHGYVKEVDTSATPNAPIAIHLQVKSGVRLIKNFPVIYVEPGCLKAAGDLPFNP
jgi:hypothetical protein